MRIRNFCLLMPMLAFTVLCGCDKGSVAETIAKPQPTPVHLQPANPQSTDPTQLNHDPAPQKQPQTLPSSEKWITLQLNQEKLQELQDSTLDGHGTSSLDPETAAMDYVIKSETLRQDFVKGNVQQDLFTDSQVILISSDQKNLFLHMVQPVKKGTGGIWVVDRYSIQ